MYHSSKGCQLETMTMGQLMEHGAAQFFKSGVKAPLYSGEAISKPSCFAMSAISFVALAGIPDASSKSP